MLQTVTCSFTHITRDEVPTALNICEKKHFLNFTNINLKIEIIQQTFFSVAIYIFIYIYIHSNRQWLTWS